MPKNREKGHVPKSTGTPLREIIISGGIGAAAVLIPQPPYRFSPPLLTSQMMSRIMMRVASFRQIPNNPRLLSAGQQVLQQLPNIAQMPPFHWDHPILCRGEILVRRLSRRMPSILSLTLSFGGHPSASGRADPPLRSRQPSPRCGGPAAGANPNTQG